MGSFDPNISIITLLIYLIKEVTHQLKDTGWQHGFFKKLTEVHTIYKKLSSNIMV